MADTSVSSVSPDVRLLSIASVFVEYMPHVSHRVYYTCSQVSETNDSFMWAFSKKKNGTTHLCMKGIHPILNSSLKHVCVFSAKADKLDDCFETKYPGHKVQK